MKKKIKFKPIVPAPEDVANMRRKLRELVSRMKADYDRWLKPIVIKMSKETRQELEQISEQAHELLSKVDAFEYLTEWEVARELHILKSTVEKACEEGKIANVIKNPQGEGYLIPSSSVKAYGISIGKIDPEQDLVDLFNERLDKLVNKYNSLLWQYQSMAENFTEKMYKRAKKKFLSQFDKETGINILRTLSEKGLRDAFDQQMAQNVQLISSIPNKYFSDIRDMVIKSTTGGLRYEGGLQQAIIDLTGATRTKAALIARDQSMKAVSTFTRLRFENLGSKKYIWHNSRDKRVAGNPNGLYPEADPKSRYHGNHWKREGKVFEWDNPPPDGNPGMPINCRCWAEPIFDED